MHQVKVYVVFNAVNDLLSHYASWTMSLSHLDLYEAIVDSSVYGDIGLMKCQTMKIKLRPDATPCSVLEGSHSHCYLKCERKGKKRKRKKLLHELLNLASGVH